MGLTPPPTPGARYRVVPAAYVYLLDAAGRVLLQRRAGTGFRDGHWAGLAGHVEDGESVLAAAVREAREEAGVDVATADLQPLCAMHRSGRTGLPVDERVDFFFSCRRWAGEARRPDDAKADALAWFGLDALPDPVVPHERLVLELIRRGEVPAVLTFGF